MSGSPDITSFYGSDINLFLIDCAMPGVNYPRNGCTSSRTTPRT